MEPEPQALCAQLAELNTRSRTYTAQIWQIPFAYIGIAGVVLAQLVDKPAPMIRVALVSIAVFGMLVFVHFTSMVNGVRRAVANIRETERLLHLRETAEYRFGWYILPLGLVIVLSTGAAVFGAYLLWWPSSQ